MPMIWTDDADKIVIDGWKAGDSLGDIAAKLMAAGFPGVNRNMVVGRRWRLSKRHEMARPQKPQKPRLAPSPPRELAAPVKRVKRVRGVTHDNGVAYLKSGDGCKAILDKRGPDGLPMCCGKQRITLKGAEMPTPYCDVHHKLYNNPATTKDTRWQRQLNSATT
jgi:hypothetical protein